MATLANPAQAGTFKDMDAGLAMLRGQPLSAATDKLGLPTEKTEMGSLAVYEWRLDTMIPMWGAPPMEVHCSIKISVDKREIIQQSSYFGQQGACSYYAKSLKPRKR